MFKRSVKSFIIIIIIFLFVYKYRVMWCSTNLKGNQHITCITVTVMTIQYIYSVKIFSSINAISSMANDGLVINLYHNTLKSLYICLYVISLVNKQIHVALPCKYLIN